MLPQQVYTHLVAKSDNSGRELRAVLTGVIVNMMLAAAKATAGVLGNTYALIADAIESLSDIFVSIIVYGGLKISVRPPDEDHPYGHGKAEPLSALVVSAALAVAAVVIALQSYNEILAPHGTPAPWTLLVLVGVIAVKETLFRFVLKVGTEGESTAVKADAWHHRSDAITSAAAFVGILIALVGGPGFEGADDYAAMFVSVIILMNAYMLARPAAAELMDAAPPPEIEEHVRAIAAGVDGVKGTHKCLIRKTGKRIFIDLHVRVDEKITVKSGHEIGHAVKSALMADDPRIVSVLVHVEPAGD